MKENQVWIGLGVAATVGLFAFFVLQQPGVYLNSQPLPSTPVVMQTPLSLDDAEMLGQLTGLD